MLRFGTSELSTVDTALLLGGVLLAQTYFDRDTRSETEIRDLAEQIYGRVDWTWAQNRPPIISHGWRPETGFLRFDWRGYNEAMLVYILALGSPTHPVEAGGVGGVAGDVQGLLGQVQRPGVPVVRPDVRSPVLARLDRLPRHPGRVHAREGHRLLREQPARRLRAARVRRSRTRCAGAATTARSGA